jgi:hypothetical protein
MHLISWTLQSGSEQDPPTHGRKRFCCQWQQKYEYECINWKRKMNIDTVMGTDTDTATKMDMVVEVDMFCFDFSYFFRG